MSYIDWYCIFNTRIHCNPLRYRVKCEWLMYWSTKLKWSFLVLDLLSTSIQYSKTCRAKSILLSRRIVKNISKCVLLITFCLFYSCSNTTNQITQNESHWSISKSRFYSWFDGVILLSTKDIAITTLLIKCSHERIIVVYNGWRMIELVCILKCQIKDYDSMPVGFVVIMRWLSIHNNAIINESCYHVLLWKESLPLLWNTLYSIYSRREIMICYHY